jgi:hypothetical protein
LGHLSTGVVAAIGESVTDSGSVTGCLALRRSRSPSDGGFDEFVSVGEQIDIARILDGLDITVTGALGPASIRAVDANDAIGVRSPVTRC